MNEKVVVVSSNSTWATYNFRKDLILGLKELGYKVVVVSPYDEYSDRIVDLGVGFRKVVLDRKGYNFIKELKLLYDFFQIYRKLNPCVVFHYTIKPNVYGSIAAGMLGVNSVAVISGLGYTFINTNPVSIIARGLYWFAMKFSKCVWFLNQDDRDVFIGSGLLSSSKADILPGEGINTDYYSPNAVDGNQTEYDFILIARMLWDKGVGEFVEAARAIKKMNKNLKFALIGPVDDNPAAIGKSQLESWSEEGVVEYLGATDDVRGIIMSSRCVVLPSYREGLPRVLLEASSMSKPVVASDVPGCRDVVDHEVTGFICKPKDADSLLESLERIVAMSADEIEEMGRAGREKVVGQYSMAQVLEKYAQYLNSTDC